MKLSTTLSRHALLAVLLMTGSLTARAQNVGIGTTAPDASAALDIVSTTRGLLAPRMTSTQRLAIVSPAVGLLVYQTDAAAGYFYNAGTPLAIDWQPVLRATATILNGTSQQPNSNFNISGTGMMANASVSTALTGSGADLGSVVGVGIRADGGLNLGQNTTGGSIYLGYQAGKVNTGSNNLFIGYLSGTSNTTGSNNQFSGANSGQNNTTGSNNQFSGANSGQSNTTGGANQFSGYNSGSSNTTGEFNQFDGIGSGRSNTTGNYNYFSGYISGANNTTGNNNQFLGCFSGVYNTTGTNNLFIGPSSGYTNTTGSNNQFSGANSGGSNTIGSNNQFSGASSGQNNTTGSNNQFSGVNSGSSNTTGFNNQFSGANSGQNNTTGNSNTVLGCNSGPAIGNGALTNATALGANVLLTTSNTLVLGNGAKVGIGTSTPSYALDVVGDINASGSVRASSSALTSDRRLKRNIVPVAYGLRTVLALRPVQYEKKASMQATAYDRYEIGFIAQELQLLMPTLVSEGTDAAKTLAVSYTELIPVLTKALQEQQAQIEALKARAATAESKATTLNTAAAQAAADHADLQTLKQQLARLLGEAPPATASAQARK